MTMLSICYHLNEALQGNKRFAIQYQNHPILCH